MAGSVADRKRLIRITAGNLRQNHIYVNGHLDFFPQDCVGSPRNRSKNFENGIEILLEGLDRKVKTDIGRDAQTGRPRGFFRGRSWVKQFFGFHKVQAGDVLVIEKRGPRQYRLGPEKRAIQGTFAGLNESPSPDEVVNVASVSHRSPFRYPGGKTWLVPHVRRWLSKTRDSGMALAEPFAGGAIVGLSAIFEDLAARLTMVELDPNVAAVWRTILNGNAGRLASRISSFKISLKSVKTVLKKQPQSLLEHAFLTVLRNRVQRGGIMAPGASLMKEGENGKGLASRWYPTTLSIRIRAIAELRNRITFIEGDGIDFIRHNAQRTDIVFFVDPPYTVAGRRLYIHSQIDHDELFALMASVRGDFLMTYDNAAPIRDMAEKFGFDTQEVAMKNTHHEVMSELLIGRNLDWARR